MATSYNLKKCPFCGSSVVSISSRVYMIASFSVFAKCGNCGAQGGEVRTHKDPAEIEPTEAIKARAADKWNEREGGTDERKRKG